MNDKICVVLLCNASFFQKMIYTLNGIRTKGYFGDVCIVIGDDLKDSNLLNHPLLTVSNTYAKHFSDIHFNESFMNAFNAIERAPLWRDKIFQYHKLHLFNVYFKQWDFIFYIDAGATVLGNIQPIIDSRKNKKLLAHSDAYHTYVWRLRDQFDKNHKDFDRLQKTYDLDIDYPQTTIMLYDTSIIEDATSKDLITLAEKWNFSITNDQGIIALCFTNVKNVWEQISLGDNITWYYDFMIRDHKKDKSHLILKRM